jgi:methionyl-tRNA synthetase
MTDTRPPIRQVTEPCPACGSYYRRGEQCNICDTHAPVAPPPKRERRIPQFGRIWSSKERRYIGVQYRN